METILIREKQFQYGWYVKGIRGAYAATAYSESQLTDSLLSAALVAVYTLGKLPIHCTAAFVNRSQSDSHL
jgi:hypothetical protein